MNDEERREREDLERHLLNFKFAQLREGRNGGISLNATTLFKTKDPK